MPVYIWQKDAFLKFCEVESLGDESVKKDIIRNQRTFGPVSFWAFLQKWHELHAECPDIEHWQKYSIDSDVGKDKNFMGNNPVIYGHGGWNRWLVYNDGEMMMSRLMAPGPEWIASAKFQGFRIFPDAIGMEQLFWQWV